jgi:hypothetical protein
MTQYGGLKAVGRKFREVFEDGVRGSVVSSIVFMEWRIGKATQEGVAETDTGKSELYQCSRKNDFASTIFNATTRNGGKERQRKGEDLCNMDASCVTNKNRLLV